MLSAVIKGRTDKYIKENLKNESGVHLAGSPQLQTAAYLYLFLKIM